MVEERILGTDWGRSVWDGGKGILAGEMITNYITSLISYEIHLLFHFAPVTNFKLQKHKRQ